MRCNTFKVVKLDGPIILLDLNATLVENTEVHTLPRTYNVHLEKYRRWLIDLIKPHYVILLTARPERYKAETLERLHEVENWQPNEAYFSDGSMKAPDIKNDFLEKHIFPKFGRQDDKSEKYMAIESNSATTAIYRSHGIKTYTQQEIFKNKDATRKQTTIIKPNKLMR